MKLKKISSIATIVLFSALILLGGVLTVLLPKKAVSESERRALEELPALSVDALISGEYFNSLSDYAVDHFALREGFRTMNTAVRVYALCQPDSNGVFEENSFLFEPVWPMDERAVLKNAEKLQGIADEYFPDKPYWFSVIPDKSDFAVADCPRIDTDEVVSIVSGVVSGEYIDITDTLELEDYYRTDTHWRQERIGDTANALLNVMGADSFGDSLAWNEIDSFKGVLWGRYALPISSESIFYGTGEVMERAVVKNTSHPDNTGIYAVDTESLDKYDIFLSGASSVIEIENPLAENGRQLVMFRDSFGSSIAPLLLTSYEKITMIDIRYISSAILSEYVDFEAADDILFLYSTSILNTGGILK